MWVEFVFVINVFVVIVVNVFRIVVFLFVFFNFRGIFADCVDFSIFVGKYKIEMVREIKLGCYVFNDF